MADGISGCLTMLEAGTETVHDVRVGVLRQGGNGFQVNISFRSEMIE